MINLLSVSAQHEIAASRRNVILIKYVFTLVFLSIIVAGSFLVGHFILDDQMRSYQRQSQEFEPQKKLYDADVKKAQDFSADLTVAKSILANEIMFSGVATKIAQTLPKNAILASLDLSIAKLTEPIDLTVRTKSYADVIAAKESFLRSKFFKDTQLKTMTAVDDVGGYTFRSVISTTVVPSEFIAEQAGQP